MADTTHLTPDGLAARWHVTRGHLANERSAGRGPAYIKVGSRVLYRLTDIEDYERAREVHPVAGKIIRGISAKP